ncbi:MAG TPA: hypothetical protein VG742_04150 [Dongiaceae bacterium]|nr:hypothetical protein [Dongiaceae bacterium]
MVADAQNTGAGRSGSDQSDGPGPADDQTRLQELSRKLLDLWQDHLSAVAQDPDLLAQALKLMSAAPFAWMPGFAAPNASQGGAGFAQSANPFPSGIFGGGFAGPASSPPAAGSATAAAASAAGADDVGQLRRRLAELEGRLARLEGARSKSGGRATGSKLGKAKPGPAKPSVGKPRRGPAKS